MTENSWPHDEGLETYETDLLIPGQGASTAPPPQTPATPQRPPQGAGSKSDAAKDEAGQVARQATDAAQNVTETVKDEASTVAAEVKTNARDLMAQAKSDLTDQAAIQQQKVAEGLRLVSTELHAMVSASDQSGVATDLVRQAGERSAAVASWLDQRDPGSLLAEVTSFARQKPGTFLLLAAGAGVLAGRLSRSLSAGAPGPAESPRPAGGTAEVLTRETDNGMTLPPTPVEPPPPLGETGTYPSDQLGTEAQTGTDRPELWHAEPVVADPLQTGDPLRDDPLDGGRR